MNGWTSRGGERVAEQVRVRRVLVVDDLADHDVADAAVERRGLAHDVDAAQLVDAERERRRGGGTRPCRAGSRC